MKNSTNDSQKFAYSIEEISEQTSLSKSYLRLEIKRKKLKAKKIGRRVIILSEDLQQYLKESVAVS